MSSDPLLAEALARIEWKLDATIRAVQMLALMSGQEATLVPSMGVAGVACPACGHAVSHQVDIFAGAVKRVCGCTTGKLPPTIALIVPVQGVTLNAAEQSGTRGSESGGGGSEPTEDRDRRKGR